MEQREKVDSWIAWLEKQCKQKSNKVEPKFKVGDWIVDNRTGVVHYIANIKGTVNGCYYVFENDKGLLHIDNEEEYHLWTIQDAKDGDVLYSHNSNLLWIYKDKTTYHASMILDYAKYNCISTNCDIVISLDTCPATKEQRDTLEKAMVGAGWEFDFEKKELKKIEQDNSPLLSNYSNNGKNAWSEEDEHRCKDAIYFLETVKKHYASDVELNACIDWLKSLKDRI